MAARRLSPGKIRTPGWRRMRRRGHPARLLALALLCLALTGCVTLRDPENSYEYSGDEIARLEAQQNLELWFESRRPGLNGIQLWLRKANSETPGTDVLTAALYHAPGDKEVLASVPITYSLIARSFPINIPLPPQDDPAGQRYLLRLETTGDPLVMYGRLEDVYPEVELKLNGNAVEAEPAYRLSYEYGARAAFSDLGSWLRSAWLAIPLLLLLWIPGQLALELAEWGRSSREDRASYLGSWDWGERSALAVGLSLSLIPLTMLWTTTLGLQWGRVTVIGAALISVAALALLTWRRWRRSGRLPRPDLNDLCLAGVFLMALAVRLAMARDLATPAWVDSVHHATLVRLIVERGGFPTSYAPYVSALTASYHPGFHSLVAAFHWLTNLEQAQAMLLIGQVLNALIVPAVYLFTKTFTRDRLAGLLAGLAAGLMLAMPAYYTSWGRYTQLAGLLVLPVCAALTLRPLAKNVFPPVSRTDEEAPFEPPASSTLRSGLADGASEIILVAVALAGLVLIHYRAAGFWGLLMAAYLVAEIIRSLDKQPLWKTGPRALAWLAVLTLPALLISLPWWPSLVQTLLLPRLAASNTPPQPLKLDWGYLTPVYGRQVLSLAMLGLALSVARAHWFGPILALWVGLLFLSANQGVITLPSAGFVNRTSVEIMLFMPMAALAGYAASAAIQAAGDILPQSWKKSFFALTVVIGFAIAVSGARLMLPILNPVTLLYREPDHTALKWIEANLPPDATILINPFRWSGEAYAGQDGGYWITPKTGRKTIPPPLFYAEGSPQEVQQVNQISQQAIERANNPAGLQELMRQHGLHYVYIGRRGGVFSAKALTESSLFQTLFAQDGMWIFELRP